ncbi:YceI family protein [Zhihengliuella halotolerans]|uniref:YceI-like domain-containing protein n=1 Tax=Zhihengliuella halotolerans TaxID=370736 RepID=A0A4Q8AGV6_9MICC|nr:YceI family protein [Zhihengliuella halotolerans]RZU62899.1 YceI-like domain-containing protein [Zhihengliuella halotolerans]
MKKRTKIILGSTVAGVVVLGAVAATAGPALYRDLVAGEAAAVPTVSAVPEAPSSSLEDGAVQDLTGTWSVADESEAGYRVDEVLNGTDVTVTGRTDRVTGTFTVDGNALTDAEIEVDVASIATDAANRDEYFRSTALRTDEFPTATFTLTEPVVGVGDGDAFEATGDLTIAGVVNTVSFPLQAVAAGDEVEVAGSIPITFEDYGVEAPDLGFVSVEPEGAVEFQLTLEQG